MIRAKNYETIFNAVNTADSPPFFHYFTKAGRRPLHSVEGCSGPQMSKYVLGHIPQDIVVLWNMIYERWALRTAGRRVLSLAVVSLFTLRLDSPDPSRFLSLSVINHTACSASDDNSLYCTGWAKKTAPNFSCNNFGKYGPILIMFSLLHSQMNLKMARLKSTTSPQICCCTTLWKNTLACLQREGVKFIEPDMWPPNSPDLNPVDYAVWGALQEMVHRQRRFTSVDELKTAIVTEWQKLSQRFINRAINQWRRRLECVVQQQGAHIKHCFWTSLSLCLTLMTS